MPINDTDFAQLVSLIEDGELDDRLIDLQRAVDDRNGRRKDDILKLVKSVWGDDATIVDHHEPNPTPRRVRPQPPEPTHRVSYEPVDDDEVPPSPPGWPDPIVSMGGGGGIGVSPVLDPMGDGADEDVTDISTGAQFR
jgi:hypothetical protein